jgi:hypothetical protein
VRFALMLIMAAGSGLDCLAEDLFGGRKSLVEQGDVFDDDDERRGRGGE